jgi:hypothetical protein
MNIIMADNKKAYLFSHFNEDEDYFGMHLKKSDDLLVVCSDPFVGETDWYPVENNSFMELSCL